MEQHILVVIADLQLRQLVSWVCDELDLRTLAVSSWRRAVADLDARPSLAIVDLDDVGAKRAGLIAVLQSGWGTPLPFIGLTHKPDSRECPEALDVLRKPINVGILMGAIGRAAEGVSRGAED